MKVNIVCALTLVVLLYGCKGTVTPSVMPHSCLDQGLPEAACTGISRNNDWVPHIQEFNGIEMALVPVGCFRMGSNEQDDEMPVHTVCFDKPFWIDVYEVTNEQYGLSECKGQCGCLGMFKLDRPRNCINYSDALKHCETRGARLPTEAEWEYAARGPDSLAYLWGRSVWNSGGKPLDEYASWIGAMEMGSGVQEWVSDWYVDDGYSGGRQINPTGPERGEKRVSKGGSEDSCMLECRGLARRWPTRDDDEYSNLGLRCALSYSP